MKFIRKMFCALVAILFFNLVLVKNIVFADIITVQDMVTDNHPLYYVLMLLIIIVIVFVSVLVLRKIYKSNQEEIGKKEDNSYDS